MKRKADSQPFRPGSKPSNPPTKPSNHNNNHASKQKKKLPPWIRALLVPDKKCPDCRNGGNIIDDPKSGRKICTSCGLVLENQIISEQSEWRTFADNDRSGPDPNRVGQAQHYLLQENGDLSTTIGHRDNAKLSNTQKAIGGNVSQSKLSRGIRDISNYCSRLSLPKDVQNFAGELFKELTSKKEMKGKKAIVMVATCVYIAAKQCHCDRPLKELCEEFGVDRASVRKIHTEIHKLKSAEKLSLPVINKGKGMIRKTTAEIFSQRFANQLKLNVNTIKNLKKIARKIMEKGLLSGKQPATIGAAAVYLTCVVSGDESERRSYKEISAVSRVSEHTISNAFKKHLFLVRKQLMPEGYGDPLRINNLTAK
eukprot:930651_1